MKFSKVTVAVAALVLGSSVITLTPFAGATSAKSGGPTSAARKPAAAGTGTLTLATTGIVQTWDPYQDDFGSFLEPEQAAYDTLIRENANGSFSPGLASAFKYTNPTTFVMTIRQGVTFDDGTSLTAAAVVQNLQRAKTVVGPKTTQLAGMTSVTSSGNAVTVKMNAPDPDLPLDFSQVLGMMVSPTALASPSTLLTTPDGVGPYILDQSQTVANTTYVFNRNPNFWDPSYTAGFQTIIFDIQTSGTATIDGLSSGQYAGGGITYQQISQAKSAGLTVISEPNYFMAIWLRETKGPLANPLVRQAMNYAINRKALQPILGGGSSTDSVFPKGTPGYSTAANNYYSYNLTKARALMKQAGYAKGITFTVSGTDYVFIGPYEEAVAAMEAKIGVHIKINNVPIGNYAALFTNLKVPAMFWYYNPADTYYDASSIYGPKGGFNPFKIKFATINKLLTEASKASTNATADKYYREMALASVKEAASGVVTNFGDSYYAFNPKLVSNIQFTVLEQEPFLNGLTPPAS
jgi:peptide/nickel transport system substrate-binding protein